MAELSEGQLGSKAVMGFQLVFAAFALRVILEGAQRPIESKAFTLSSIVYSEAFFCLI